MCEYVLRHIYLIEERPKKPFKMRRFFYEQTTTMITLEDSIIKIFLK